MATVDGSEVARERRRVVRQRTIVVGLGLTFLGIVAFLAAPDLTGPLVHDLPYLAAGLSALYVGAILLGVGLGRRSAQR